MIPVLITSIVNRPDLLDRMFDTVDVPVGRSLVVDNGHVGYRREGVTVFEPPFESLGWPGTLNFGITQTPDAPWWFFTNNDAYFEPGVLARLAARMDAADRPLLVTDGYTVGALNRAMVDTVGLFDDWSFYPIYFDDTDYTFRCSLAGFPVEHGKWCLEGDIGQTDVASQTIRADDELREANNRTWKLNEAAYVAKWGGRPGQERFMRPWDLNLPLWATKPDMAGRAARRW